MSQGESALVSVFKTVDNIKNAIELGQSDIVVADTAKLFAQVSTAIATEGFLRTYSSLGYFGSKLSNWRLGHGISGAGIQKQQALAGWVAAELVGKMIDEVRGLGIGGWIYDLLHPTTGSGGSGSGTNPIWKSQFDIYQSVHQQDGSVSHTWFDNGVVIDTMVLPSVVDIWPFANIDAQATYESHFLQDIPSTYLASNGAQLPVDEFLLDLAASDFLEELEQDFGQSAIAEQLDYSISQELTGDWRISFSISSGNPNSALHQRFIGAGAPKGMDDYQRWFQERAESITRDVVEHYGAQIDPSESGEVHGNNSVAVPHEHSFQRNPGGRHEAAGIEASRMTADLPKLGRITSGKGAFDDVELTLDSTASLHDRQSQVLVNAMAAFQLDGAMETMPHMRSLPWQRNEQYLVSAQ